MVDKREMKPTKKYEFTTNHETRANNNLTINLKFFATSV